VLNKTFVADDNLCPDIRIIEPRKDNHGRLVNQAGLFIFSPYDSTIENKLADTLASEDSVDDELRNASEDEQPGIIARYICKIYIKNEGREGCMRHLRRMNVHHASLFPDLIGASQHSNLLVAEERREYEIDLLAKREKIVTTFPGTVTLGPATAQDSDNNEVAAIAQILEQHGKKQVEPGRVQLIAEHLSKELIQHKIVDWHKRESVVAKMRSMIRIALRKYGYPNDVRDETVDVIMNMLSDRKGKSSI